MEIAMRYAASLAAVAMLATAAEAACYEGIGCSDSQKFPEAELRKLSCQALYEVRNIIYKDNGYCFQTESAIAAFGNQGCSIADQSKVRLNSFERYNVGLIRKVERRKGC